MKAAIGTADLGVSLKSRVERVKLIAKFKDHYGPTFAEINKKCHCASCVPLVFNVNPLENNEIC